jgi:hypothetical protein
MTEREQLEGAIASLESQRAVLGDAAVDTALAALRAKLSRLGRPEEVLDAAYDRPARVTSSAEPRRC